MSPTIAMASDSSDPSDSLPESKGLALSCGGWNEAGTDDEAMPFAAIAVTKKWSG